MSATLISFLYVYGVTSLCHGNKIKINILPTLIMTYYTSLKRSHVLLLRGRHYFISRSDCVKPKRYLFVFNIILPKLQHKEYFKHILQETIIIYHQNHHQKSFQEGLSSELKAIALVRFDIILINKSSKARNIPHKLILLVD